MLNKELLIGNTDWSQPVAFTVGSSTHISGSHYYGYDNGHFGKLAPDPFWGNYTYLDKLAYDDKSNYTMCAATDRSIDVTVYVSGYHDSPIRTGESILGDVFSLQEKVGQTVYLTFDPPPDGYI